MSIRIFLADDHTVLRDGLRALLEAHADLRVVGEAADGRETVSRVKEQPPDVVVMDIAMPELNGIEATRQIRACCPATRVVILSVHSTTEHIFRALQAGAQGYLLKESAGAEVVTAVRAVHAGERYLSNSIANTMLDGLIRQEQTPPTPSPLERLSVREREILQLVAEGKSSNEIAQRLSLSVKTVETYRSRLMKKLDIHDHTALIKFAIRHGLTSPE